LRTLDLLVSWNTRAIDLGIAEPAGRRQPWPNPATSEMAARFFEIVADNAIQRSYAPSHVAAPANRIAKNTI
jgi:hypothetical protein